MLHDAIYELYEDAVSIKGNTVEEVEVFDENGDAVSIVADDVTAKVTELETAESYKIARAFEYPSIIEFVEAYTEKEIGEDSTKWDAYVVKYNQVREDNPKE
tara:strand:- start:49 stop:354 length:306 start_codon:yes stop_codon:yes gene_type:complete